MCFVCSSATEAAAATTIFFRKFLFSKLFLAFLSFSCSSFCVVSSGLLFYIFFFSLIRPHSSYVSFVMWHLASMRVQIYTWNNSETWDKCLKYIEKKKYLKWKKKISVVHIKTKSCRLHLTRRATFIHHRHLKYYTACNGIDIWFFLALCSFNIAFAADISSVLFCIV